MPTVALFREAGWRVSLTVSFETRKGESVSLSVPCVSRRRVRRIEDEHKWAPQKAEMCATHSGYQDLQISTTQSCSRVKPTVFWPAYTYGAVSAKSPLFISPLVSVSSGLPSKPEPKTTKSISVRFTRAHSSSFNTKNDFCMR
eukprot:6473566-Pyramimonas_sp.AAC.1